MKDIKTNKALQAHSLLGIDQLSAARVHSGRNHYKESHLKRKLLRVHIAYSYPRT